MADLERRFTSEELSDLILRADALKGLDDEVKSHQIIEFIDSHNGDLIDLKTAYEIGEEIGIPREYLKKALNLYPSVGEQLSDLDGHNAYEPIDITVQTYRQALNKALTDIYPFHEFKAWHDTTSPVFLKFFKIERKFKKKVFFGRFREPKVSVSKKRLAFLSFSEGSNGHFSLNAEFDDPLFLHACSRTLKGLNERYERYLKGYSTKRNYRISND